MREVGKFGSLELRVEMLGGYTGVPPAYPRVVDILKPRRKMTLFFGVAFRYQ